MSNLVAHAKKELDLLFKDKKDEFEQSLAKNILECVETFAKYGHSGSSAAYSVEVLQNLLKFRPLTPLTGLEDEWMDVSEYIDDDRLVNLKQNKRNSSVFKENDRAYDLDGYYFVDQNGYRFTKRKFIEFPYSRFEPAFVEVIEKEDGLRYLKSDESVCVDHFE